MSVDSDWNKHIQGTIVLAYNVDIWYDGLGPLLSDSDKTNFRVILIPLQNTLTGVFRTLSDIDDGIFLQ